MASLAPRSIRSASVAVLLLLSPLAAAQAPAGTITLYTDRAAWETDALAAGLSIATEDFAAQPPSHPFFSLGGIDLEVLPPQRAAQNYDAGNERLGYTSGGGRTLGIDYIGGTTTLFGFAVDTGPTVVLVNALDVDGDDLNTGGGGTGFVGVLGTAALAVDPSTTEVFTSGLSSFVWYDNVSVAFVPEPGTAVLLGAGLLGLVLRARRR